MKKITLFLLKAYKATLSPLLEALFGKGCRFSPSCSVYAYRAIEKFGMLEGGKMAFRRIIKCHPLSGEFGSDPIPRVRKRS